MMPLRSIAKQKMIYPSKNLQESLVEDGKLYLNESQLTHDALVSSVCLGMLKFDLFDDAEIEDFLIGTSKFASKRGFYPDAVLYGDLEDESFSLPIELELTQKSRTRMMSKFMNYLDMSYENVLFFFFDERVARKYHKEYMKHAQSYREKGRLPQILFSWGKCEEAIKGDLSDYRVLIDEREEILSKIWAFKEC